MPPFRAEHIGSLLRPQVLKDAVKSAKSGEISQAEYEAILDREIAKIVKMQEDVGLHAITDGDLGRVSWLGFFFERIEGFRLEEAIFNFQDDHGHSRTFMTGYADRKMTRPRPIAVDEFVRLKRLTHQTAKETLPTPSSFHFYRGNDCRSQEAYPDIEQWWQDLIDIYKTEISALADAGCTYLQLDEVPLAMLCDSSLRTQAIEVGLDPDQLVEKYISVANAIIEDRPPSMSIGMHLCRGNLRSMWMASGGYEPVAERLFNEVNVDSFFLEYDNERAGDFSPLRYVPNNKHIVLGLVSTKTPALEDPDQLKQRIDEASKFVPIDRLSLSPQCGFASVAGGNALSEAEQTAKLRLVVDVANDVWKQ